MSHDSRRRNENRLAVFFAPGRRALGAVVALASFGSAYRCFTLMLLKKMAKLDSLGNWRVTIGP
jgi:hypothetical protein